MVAHGQRAVCDSSGRRAKGAGGWGANCDGGDGGERVRDARVLFGGARESGRHFGTSVVQEAHASGARTPPDQCSAPVYVDVGASSSPSAANSIFLHFYFLKASAGLQPPPRPLSHHQRRRHHHTPRLLKQRTCVASDDDNNNTWRLMSVSVAAHLPAAATFCSTCSSFYRHV